MRALQAFFGTFRFPALALALLVGHVLLLLALLLVPRGDGALAAFAAEFRTWCFGQDPATGSLEWGYVVTMLTAPLLLGAALVWGWGAPLREVLRRRPRAPLPWVGAGLLLSALSAAAFAGLGAAPVRGELPFPAESLRTEVPAPELALTDQRGERIALRDLRGQVVVITAVYATCGYTCPMIMAQTRAALAELDLEERRDLAVLGITLDPARDTPAVLAAMVEAQGLASERVHLLTGEPERVERALDRLGFARQRDPATGVIDHANLFLVVDREGRIAYRFSLGERQQSWLVAALRLLLAEPAG